MKLHNIGNLIMNIIKLQRLFYITIELEELLNRKHTVIWSSYSTNAVLSGLNVLMNSSALHVGKSIRSAFVYFFLKFSKSERTSSRKQKPSQQNIRWYEMRFNEIFLIFVHTQARERWSDETRRKSFVGILFQFNIDSPLILRYTWYTFLVMISQFFRGDRYAVPNLTAREKNIDDLENSIWIFHCRNWAANVYY